MQVHPVEPKKIKNYMQYKVSKTSKVYFFVHMHKISTIKKENYQFSFMILKLTSDSTFTRGCAK